MSLFEAAVVIVVVAAILVAVFLGIRHIVSPRLDVSQGLPVGVSEVFTVIGLAFVIVLGFVAVESFQSFQRARQAARDEAHAVRDAYMDAALLPDPYRSSIQTNMICYAYSVIDSWPTLDARLTQGESDPAVDDASDRITRALRDIPAIDENVASTYFNLIDAQEDRARQRAARLTEGSVFVPQSLRIVLWVAGLIVVGFVFFFSLHQRRLWMQISLIVVTVVMLTLMAVTIEILDHPYSEAPGSIGPTAMEGALVRMKSAEGADIARAAC